LCERYCGPWSVASGHDSHVMKDAKLACGLTVKGGQKA
jgi:hypothetical protein